MVKREDPLFFTISRADENGTTFKGIYKSECRKNTGKNGDYLFNRVYTDTDTLARSEDNCEIRLQIYLY